MAADWHAKPWRWRNPKPIRTGPTPGATLQAYATDVANFEAWCAKHRFAAMLATPETVGAYLAAAREGYAMPTWLAQACQHGWFEGHVGRTMLALTCCVRGS
jgi:hypothetical protein